MVQWPSAYRQAARLPDISKAQEALGYMLLYSMAPTIVGIPARVTILTGVDKFKTMLHVPKYVSFR